MNVASTCQEEPLSYVLARPNVLPAPQAADHLGCSGCGCGNSATSVKVRARPSHPVSA